jgi:NADH:ubiquinone oxidoreductase subunit
MTRIRKCSDKFDKFCTQTHSILGNAECSRRYYQGTTIDRLRGRHRRVVVTGMGAVSPLGNTLTESWNNLIHGSDSTTTLSGITTLEEALVEHQNLSSTQLDYEWKIAKSTGTKLDAGSTDGTICANGIVGWRASHEAIPSKGVVEWTSNRQ